MKPILLLLALALALGACAAPVKPFGPENGPDAPRIVDSNGNPNYGPK